MGERLTSVPAHNIKNSELNSHLQNLQGINDELAKLALKATGYYGSFRGKHVWELARKTEEHDAAEFISTSMTKAQVGLTIDLLADLACILGFACEIVAADVQHLLPQADLEEHDSES